MTQVEHKGSLGRTRAMSRLKGAFDLHIHSGADWVARLLSDEEAVLEARAAGMSGILLKSHSRHTLEACRRMQRKCGGTCRAFAGLVLNSMELVADVEGVTRLIQNGVNVVYMPTTMAANDANPLHRERARVSITQNGGLVDSLREILKAAAKHNCAVATGHCGRYERSVLLSACARAGVKTVLVTHPEYHVTEMTLDEQCRMAERFPNVLFERTLYSLIDEASARSQPGLMKIMPERLNRMIAGIRATGARRTILTSDLGQTFLPRPVEGFAAFLETLANSGISETDIEIMTRVNPLCCLGLHDRMLAETLRVAFEDGRGEFGSSFRKPLIGWAHADDTLFAEFRRCANRDHRLPGDVLPGAASVISVFLPFGKDLVDTNRPGKRPSPEWCRAYTDANVFLDMLTASLCDSIRRAGFEAARSAAAHHLTGCHDPNIDAGLLTSNWSQRHVAYACGLGTFGLNNLLITEKGCAGRFSSLVTTLPLPQRPRADGQRCLEKARRACGMCILRCPAGALSRDGFDRIKCWRYLVRQNDISREHGFPVVNVCGKCSTGVPCATVDRDNGA